MGVAPVPVELAPGVAESGGGAVAYGLAFGFQEMNGFVEIKTEIALDQLEFEIVRGARGIAFSAFPLKSRIDLDLGLAVVVTDQKWPRRFPREAISPFTKVFCR